MAILSFEDVQKRRVNGTYEGIMAKLDNVSMEEISTELFVKTDSALAKELIKMYESQLTLAKEKPREFKWGLYKFFERTGKFIIKRNLIPEFLDFCYFLYTELNVLGDFKKGVINAYMDMAMQQSTHLFKEQWVYGMSTESGEPLIMDEIYPKLDYPMYELQKTYGKNFHGVLNKQKAMESYVKSFRKYGYSMKSMEESVEMIMAEQKIQRQIFVMAPLINDATMDIACESYYKSFVPFRLIDAYKEEDLLERIRADRTHTLPFSGIRVKCSNMGDITEILMKERIYCNRLHLLFKMTLGDKGEYSGFIDLDRGVDFTFWRDSRERNYMHGKTIRLVKEAYWRYTCDNSVDKVLKLEVNEENELMPSIKFIEKTLSAQGGVGGTLDKSQYTVAESVIAPFIRRLQEGQKASEAAIQRALEYGYILKPGETFVRQHTKTVYRSADSERR